MKTPTRYLTTVAAGVLACSSALAGVKVFPDDVVETTFTAQFVRADLETAAGAKSAYATLRTLARRACTDPSADFIRSATSTGAQRCIAATLEDAVKQLDAPLVDELHNSRY